MSAGVPVTIWQNPVLEGDFSASGNPNLATESNIDLLTENSVNLITEDSTFTQLPATVWSPDDSM